MSTEAAIRAAAALLAFLLALYALAARERKTPYIVGSVYSTSIVVLCALAVAIILDLIHGTALEPYLKVPVTVAINVILLLLVAYIVYRVIRLQNIHLHFRDDRPFNNSFLYRWVKEKMQRLESGRSYTFKPAELTPDVIAQIREHFPNSAEQITRAAEQSSKGERPSLSLSAVLKVETLANADYVLLDLAKLFLRNNLYVQYATCARHPIELMLQLEKQWKADEKDGWPNVARHIVVVDAYTPHFGFTDSTHARWTGYLREEGITVVGSSPSFAGMHTAATRAFKEIKKLQEQGGQPRPPTLVIYENPYALVDLESAEQYRIFVRHVLPSEKLWGGMFTFVVEAAIGEEDWNLLRFYADILLDDLHPESKVVSQSE